MDLGNQINRADLDQLKGSAVIEFGATWCGYCQEAQSIISAAFVHYPNIKHIKIEDAKGKRLGRTYSVKLWPTLVFLKDGIEIRRLVRPTDTKMITNVLNEIELMNQETLWSNRYRDVGERYLFGTEPSHFLANRADIFKKSETALSLADGEGRNSVWLAEKGLSVTAVEISAVAIDKAKRLALDRRVDINFLRSDMLFQDWEEADFIGKFDWVIGIFIQFVGREGMTQQFEVMRKLTRSGGRIALHGYTPKQLEYKTGGPSDINNLYTKEILLEAFSGWEIEELIEYEDDVSEGIGHNGQSALIGLIAKKT